VTGDGPLPVTETGTGTLVERAADSSPAACPPCGGASGWLLVRLTATSNRKGFRYTPHRCARLHGAADQRGSLAATPCSPQASTIAARAAVRAPFGT
jgi:hypothetical protein